MSSERNSNDICHDIYRGARAIINLSHLEFNFKQILELCPEDMSIIPVVKANAYGHGLGPVIQSLINLALDSNRLSAFAVASPEEALQLRALHAKIPIICLGGLFQAPLSLFEEYQITPVLHQLEHLDSILKNKSLINDKLKCLVKFDTGMGRLGFLVNQAKPVLEKLAQIPELEVLALMTHLACADVIEDPLTERLTKKQLQSFRELCSLAKNILPKTQLFHIANSAAIIRREFAGFNQARPGIMLYGSYPNPSFREQVILKPVMELRTRVISVKDFGPGESISYGATFVTQKQTKVAVIALGYADGYSRAFSNCGEVLIRGQRCPVLGRVCMDHTMVDVTALDSVGSIQLGDDVLVFGEELPVEEVAAKIDTISYELFCSVSSRVPRIYV